MGDQTVLDNYGRWKNLIKDARTQEYLVDAMRHPELFAIYDEKVVDMGILDILSSTLGLMASRPVSLILLHKSLLSYLHSMA